MLIYFEGAGCTNCPFYDLNVVVDSGITVVRHLCKLDGRRESGIERPFDIKIMAPEHKPKNCPFTEYIGALEVFAEVAS